MSTESGTLTLQDGLLRYVCDGAEIWSLRIDNLRLIAEHTNENGPVVDDYFYAFWVGEPAALYEAPMYANTGLMTELSAALRVELHGALAHSTTFNSRVIWPAALTDHAYLSFSPERRSAGLLNRLKDAVLPLVHSELTEEVASFLGVDKNGTSFHPG